MSSIRVIHVAEITVGGIASHLAEILPLQVDLLGKGNVALLLPKHERAHVPEIDGLVVETFSPATSRLRSAWTLSRRLKELCRTYRPDIVHAHSSFGGLAARLFGGAGSTPVIYCPHGWPFTQDIAEWKKHVYALAERIQLARTDFVINVSHHERTVALNYRLPDSPKLAVIENGISEKIAPYEGLVPSLDPNLIHLAFIGRANRAKGLDILIDEARALVDHDIHFHLVGPSADDDADVLADLPANMTAYGWRPRAFALALLEQVDGLVMPSRWEGLPMIGIEAMRASKPVIASNRAAIPELVQDGLTGILVDISTSGALRAALSSLSKARLRELGTAGRRRFEDRYVIERQILKFADLYQRSALS